MTPAFHVTPDALAQRYIWIEGDRVLVGTAISSDDIRQMLG